MDGCSSVPRGVYPRKVKVSRKAKQRGEASDRLGFDTQFNGQYLVLILAANGGPERESGVDDR
jgi:hypothetical protein